MASHGMTSRSVGVEALNGAGLWSAPAMSDGVLVERTAPMVGSVSDGANVAFPQLWQYRSDRNQVSQSGVRCLSGQGGGGREWWSNLYFRYPANDEFPI